ncbi:MAG: type I restriction endonuclease subunit R, partial [Candidatus Thorarchaeota archaeon]|nr:type I restriction endonuclease subunit R [Candidatus Thorarchaeota archaeon]
MKTYREQDFEEHIEEHLLNSGYIKSYPETYDKDLCLITDEVIAFIQNTQPKEWRKLERQYGKDARKRFLYRLSQEISRHGSLPILRKGIKDRDAKFSMAYFKPASGMNPEHQRLYQGNRFAIVRQLKYSKQNENSLDMVIFLNGLPIITMELKNSLTGQFVENAIKQYKNDRDPREPLFKYKRCLVHFAVGNEKVFMTTKLSGEKTNFLPFNKDTENPVNPYGHQTAYLWEDILQPAMLLTLIQSYLHVQKVTEKFYDKASHSVKEIEHESFIFPRYHQLDVVRQALRYTKERGAGHNYLVQHSTGSGKSNSIAWLAHQLAHLYQTEVTTERLFDSIIVVTDRRILDRQLQNTIKQFEQTKGVVKPIDMHSRQLKEALEKGKDIIITTLQKFPVISESMTQLKGKRFAVIVDEAHSSQSGESVKHLQQTLSVNLEDAEKADEVEDVSFENEILKQIELRGKQPHISYFAFTATPKGKTLEKFGYKTEEGKFVAHHIYSMRQAIEEGFVMDVLENYTTYKRYFKLIKTIADDKRYEKSKAIRVALDYVDIHPHEIETKARIMLEHFLAKTMNAVQGRGRAMVTTRSRLHAVKYYLIFRKLLKESNLDFKPLVAFSGTVIDPDNNAEYTENSLNQLPPKVSIEDAFKIPEYRILICAEKFQTGFDEPMLHTMYVDKRLGGIHAVQTLGRLNRKMYSKDSTMILDFVNTVEDIQTSFQDYYQTTFLDEETDPNKLHSLHDQLLEYEIFTDEDVEHFAEIFFNQQEPPEKLQPILDEVVKRFRYVSDENSREEFRSVLQSYNRMYGYLSQIMPWKDVELEKLYVFGRYLNRKLPKRIRKLPNEIRDAIDLESFRIQKTFDEIQVTLQKDDGHTIGIIDGTRHAGEEEKDLLSNIIKSLNEAYGLNLSEENK